MRVFMALVFVAPALAGCLGGPQGADAGDAAGGLAPLALEQGESGASSSEPTPAPSSPPTTNASATEAEDEEPLPPEKPVHPTDPAIRERWEEYEATGRLTFLTASRVILGQYPMPQETLELELAPMDFMADDWFFEIDGIAQELPWLVTLTGARVGESGSSARVLFTDTWVGGVLLSGSVTYMLGFGYESYGETFDETTASIPNPFRAQLAQPPLPGAPHRPIDYEEAEEGSTCDIHPVPIPITPIAPTFDPGGPRLLRLIVDADAAARDELGANLTAFQVALMLGLDAVYEREVGIRVQLMGLHSVTDASRYSEPDLPQDLIDYWNTRSAPRDLVHLFKWDNGATVAGQANCIGGAGDPAIAYVFSDVAGHGPHQDLMIVLHEVGHILSAHHHYANCVESVVACTIMVNDIGLNWKQFFSTINRSVIRGWAEANLGPAA